LNRVLACGPPARVERRHVTQNDRHFRPAREWPSRRIAAFLFHDGQRKRPITTAEAPLDGRSWLGVSLDFRHCPDGDVAFAADFTLSLGASAIGFHHLKSRSPPMRPTDAPMEVMAWAAKHAAISPSAQRQHGHLFSGQSARRRRRLDAGGGDH
jgi:hypothetical protein